MLWHSTSEICVIKDGGSPLGFLLSLSETLLWREAASCQVTSSPVERLHGREVIALANSQEDLRPTTSRMSELTGSSSAVPELSQTEREWMFVVFSGWALGYLVTQHKITDTYRGCKQSCGNAKGSAPLAKEFGEGFEKNAWVRPALFFRVISRTG